MRLSLAVLTGSRRIRVDSDTFWTRCPKRPRSRPGLRRILDQVPGTTPFPPGTQTQFGPADAKQGRHVARVRFATGLRARRHHCENGPFPPRTSASPQGWRPAPPETAAEAVSQSEGLQDEAVVREMGLEPIR